MLNLDQYTLPGRGAAGCAGALAQRSLPDRSRPRPGENPAHLLRFQRDGAAVGARRWKTPDFGAGGRAAIIMTNQSKWLISAYAIFYCGGVLVPLDYKLTAARTYSTVGALSGGACWWLNIISGGPSSQSPEFKSLKVGTVLVTEAPPGADLAGAFRWEDFRRKGDPTFVPRQREDTACIVYSSGTGGRPKGCVLTHENYLEQCKSLTALYPFWPGVRYLSILPTNHAIDFMVGFIGPFVCGACVVHLRTLRPGVRARCFRPLQDHLHEPGSHGAQESGTRTEGQAGEAATR